MSFLSKAGLAILMIVISLGLTLVAGEFVLRMLSPERYFVFPPGTERVNKPHPELMPGTSGEARFIINESGMRADPFPEDDRFKILAVGGSTTICSFLDQEETWTHLVQEKLSTAGRKAWVGNVGRNGHNSRHHMLHVERLLDQHADLDLVIILVGVNDMSMRLKRDVNYRRLEDEDPAYRDRLIYQTFSVFPLRDANNAFYFKNTEIYRLLRQVRRKIRYRKGNTQLEDAIGLAYQRRREFRADASTILNTLPDLSEALGEYQANLKRIIDLAQERDVQVVFLTQPYMWRKNLPDSLSRLLWLGGIGDFQIESGKPYYSVEALAEAMQTYNQTLLNVCRDRGVSCLDLEPLIAKDTTSFSDGVHFNEQGARTVADAVAGFLLEKGLVD